MGSQLYIQNKTLLHNSFVTLKSSRSVHVAEFCFLFLEILPKKYLVMRELSSLHKIRTAGPNGHRYVALTRGQNFPKGPLNIHLNIVKTDRFSYV